jgi:Plasmid pRiA4b ORF-3-like protein
MARKKPAKKSKLIADQAVALAEYAAKALVAAEQFRIKTKAVERFPLDADEQATVAELPSLPAKLKKKLLKKDGTFTVTEIASMVMTAAESFMDAEPKQQVALLLVATKLMDCLRANIVMPDLRPVKMTRPTKAKPADTVYQFKITLQESHPPIWRRIQVQDCTLDKLHEHIQTAMGWTNSHLHHFRIEEQLYGDPDLMQENFEEMEYEDSTTMKISDILPRTGKRFRFQYEYDFGDSWYHEVLFEGVVQAESKVKYPLCLEGARACPPEDCGGFWGYADFVEAIQNTDHEQHEELLEWVGGRFDPEAFDPAKATKAMRKGLPDWRSMAGW